MVFAGFDPTGVVTGDFLRRVGGELTAEGVGEEELDADCLMSTGSARGMGGLTDWLGEMKWEYSSAWGRPWWQLDECEWEWEWCECGECVRSSWFSGSDWGECIGYWISSQLLNE